MLSQIELICAICKHLDKQGVKSLVPRQYNAVIEAANLICDAIAREPVPASHGMGLAAWLASDDTGASSLYLASVLGGFVKQYAHPHDADDFGRCMRLLEAVPEFDLPLVEMRGKSPQWDALLDSWGAIRDRIAAEDFKTANEYIREALADAEKSAKDVANNG